MCRITVLSITLACPNLSPPTGCLWIKKHRGRGREERGERGRERQKEREREREREREGEPELCFLLL
jgi:hypothetical protein